MAIHVQCAECGAKFQAPEKLAGKRVKCPKCSAVITFPTDPYSGQPMRMTTIRGESVIYSVAMDGKDDRGRMDVWENYKHGKPEGDIIFRLEAPR